MKILEIGLYKYSKLTFDKGAKAIQQEKVIFSTNSTGISGHLYMKKKKKNTSTIPHAFIKINSKWIIDQYVKSKIIKCLEEKIGGNPSDCILSRILRYNTKNTTHTRKNNNKMDFIKI